MKLIRPDADDHIAFKKEPLGAVDRPDVGLPSSKINVTFNRLDGQDKAGKAISRNLNLAGIGWILSQGHG